MANSVFNRAPQKKLDVKIGKSAGQKATDKEYRELKDGKDISVRDGLGGGDMTAKSNIVDAALYNSGSPTKKRDADKANKKQVKRMNNKAKVGKAKAEKALGRKIPDSAFKR